MAAPPNTASYPVPALNTQILLQWTPSSSPAPRVPSNSGAIRPRPHGESAIRQDSATVTIHRSQTAPLPSSVTRDSAPLDAAGAHTSASASQSGIYSFADFQRFLIQSLQSPDPLDSHPPLLPLLVILNEYSCKLRLLKSKRDLLYSKLTQVLVAKGKADDQNSWRVIQNEKLARLRDKLRLRKEQVSQGKAKIEKLSHDLKIKYELLESAMSLLEKNRTEQIEKYYPNLICTQSLGHMAITSERLHKQSVIIKQICKLFPQRRVCIDGERKDGYSGLYDTICNARMPRGLDPHSVPSEELASSLGYMVQLLNLVVHAVCAPALHNSGFAGSCSRIWQRESYWDARPSSRSEYPLFIPRQNFCTTGGETSWSEKSSSNFGVASMESERKPRLDSPGGSFNYSSASPHSIELHKDLQKGISLLKKSVACITAYCYNSLSLEVPSEASTFEAFARLLATLSSSKEVRSVLSSRMVSSRSKPCPQLNTSIWNVESAISSSTLMESAHTQPILRNAFDNYLPSFAGSYLYANEFSDLGKNENLIDEWDLVEHPTFPPPPSQIEDVEHWTRAMFIDATKK